MRIGEYFKNKRLEKNMTEKDVAEKMGPDFQASLLWDFEEFDDNDIDGWTVKEFKKYCEILGIIPKTFYDVPIINKDKLPLSKLLMERRIEKRMDIEELAECIGYEPIVIKALEENNLDIVCLDALKQVSLALDIPFQIILEKI